VIVDLHDEASLVEWNTPLAKIFQHVVGHGARFQVFQKQAHWGLVWEHALLLIKSEVGGVQVYD
jgi:hypothetical protein